MTKKLDLTNVLLKIDHRSFDYWNQLDAAEQKELKSTLFILNRYVSNIAEPKSEWKDSFKRLFKVPSRDEQEYFVLSVNEYFNKNWMMLQHHPELLWKLLCLCGYSVRGKKFFHQWIGLNKIGANNKKSKLLAELYPTKKLDEIELLAKLSTNEELITLAKDHGIDEAEAIKRLK